MCTGDRNIKALKLRCSNNEKGCLWTGELRSIDEHHSTCGYSSIQCPNHCTDGKKEVYLLRKNLKNHVSRKCFKRQYNCPHCNETGEYQEITTGHLQVCPQVEVSCGNVGCKETVPRCQLEAHHFNCPFELLDCVYHGRGCQRKLLRKNFERHLQNQCPKRWHMCPHCKESGMYDQITTEHLDTCTMIEVDCPNIYHGCDVRTARCNVEYHLQECQYEMVACKYAGIGCITRLLRKNIATHENNMQKHFFIALQTVEELREKLDQNSRIINSTSFHFKLTRFIELKSTDSEFYSEPFYTHHGGYRVVICIHANGYRESSKGTHTSVYIHLMKGKHDCDLQWPFPATVTVNLLNQLEDRHHHSASISIPPNEADVSGRVEGDRERGIGYGRHKFISHTDLAHNPADNCQYLKDDCLYFRIDTDMPNAKPWLMCSPSS